MSIFELSPDGIIKAFGQRVIVLRINTRASIRATLLDILGVTGGRLVLEILGEKIGSEAAQIALDKGLIKGLDESTFKFLQNVYLNSGWGKWEYEKRGDEIIARVYNPFEADAHKIAFGEVEEPSCFFTRGYLKGFFSTLLGKEVDVVEEKCKARGDEYCEFHIKPALERNE